MSTTRRSKQFIKNKRRISAIKSVFRSYRHRCKKRNIEWNISFEVFYSLVLSECAICGKKPSNKSKRKDIVNCFSLYNGIDRIDNAIGYVEGNVRACCKLCNAMKSNLKEKVFKKHLIRISQKIAERKSRRRS